jgi:hypothetical protein
LIVLFFPPAIKRRLSVFEFVVELLFRRAHWSRKGFARAEVVPPNRSPTRA